MSICPLSYEPPAQSPRCRKTIKTSRVKLCNNEKTILPAYASNLCLAGDNIVDLAHCPVPPSWDLFAATDLSHSFAMVDYQSNWVQHCCKTGASVAERLYSCAELLSTVGKMFVVFRLHLCLPVLVCDTIISEWLLAERRASLCMFEPSDVSHVLREKCEEQQIFLHGGLPLYFACLGVNGVPVPTVIQFLYYDDDICMSLFGIGGCYNIKKENCENVVLKWDVKNCEPKNDNKNNNYNINDRHNDNYKTKCAGGADRSQSAGEHISLARICFWSSQTAYSAHQHSYTCHLLTPDATRLLMFYLGDQHKQHPFEKCLIMSVSATEPYVEKTASEMQLFPNHFGYYAITPGNLSERTLIAQPQLCTKNCMLNRIGGPAVVGAFTLFGLEGKEMITIRTYRQIHRVLPFYIQK